MLYVYIYLAVTVISVFFLHVFIPPEKSTTPWYIPSIVAAGWPIVLPYAAYKIWSLGRRRRRIQKFMEELKQYVESEIQQNKDNQKEKTQ
ncbi:MAG: hypothetical protein ACOH2T_19105 [Pseudomonas sp.]